MPAIGEFEIAPGYTLQTTPVFDAYWKFASERQAVFWQRVKGIEQPWTLDPIIRENRFTNPYRASDRVSQFLIKNVIYEADQSSSEVIFRILLFKLFNRIDTWTALEFALGAPRWSSYCFDEYAQILNSRMLSGLRVYSSAYIMPSPPFGEPRKHLNHLRLVEHMMNSGVVNQIESSESLEQMFGILKSYPSLGDFLAFQMAIDINYSEVVNHSEMEFVVAGPGAKNGIKKCFIDKDGFSELDIIRAVARHAKREFRVRGLEFTTIGNRPLQLIDCQNLFCEVDKYARVAYPEFEGISKRSKIKQRFHPKSDPISQWYPPKWKVDLCNLLQHI